jgi:enamine deaminase RidA (YjgF/YER057c/UK114 family)
MLMNVESRLVELGITLPDATPSLASYVPTVRYGNFIYVSGQLPMLEGRLIYAGKVGGDVSLEAAVAAARQCAVNAIAALKAEVGDLSSVSRIVKLTGYVASDPTFTGQSQVVNGASDLMLALFGDVGHHARAAIGVACLPLDAPVQIELIVGVA